MDNRFKFYFKLGHPDIEYIDELVIDVKRLPSNYYHENTMFTDVHLSFGFDDDGDDDEGNET